MGNELIKFWCNTHGHEYSVERSRTKPFCTRDHLSIEGFPKEDYLKYCCKCAVYWKDEGGEEQCLRGKHQITKRYLCNECKVMTLDTEDPAGKKFFISDDNLPNPSCPGCRSRAKSPVDLHECQNLGVSFWTARSKCMFCKKDIEQMEEEKPVEVQEPVVEEEPAKTQEPPNSPPPTETPTPETKKSEDQNPPGNPPQSDTPPPEANKKRLEIYPMKLDFGRVSQNKDFSKPKEVTAKNCSGTLEVKPAKSWLEITEKVRGSEEGEWRVTIKAKVKSESLEANSYNGQITFSDSSGSSKPIDCCLEVRETLWHGPKGWTSTQRILASIAALLTIIVAPITIYKYCYRPDPIESKIPPALKVDIIVPGSTSNPSVHIGQPTTLKAIVHGKNDGNLTYKWSDNGRDWVKNSEKDETTITVPKDIHKKLPFETTVNVEVRDGSGVLGSCEKPISVTNSSPEVTYLSITPDKPRFQSGEEVIFSATAVDKDEDDHKLIYSWRITWTGGELIGNGKEYTLNTSQIKPLRGSTKVSVQVEVEDEHGGKGEDKKEIDVTPRLRAVKPRNPQEGEIEIKASGIRSTEIYAQVGQTVPLLAERKYSKGDGLCSCDWKKTPGVGTLIQNDCFALLDTTGIDPSRNKTVDVIVSVICPGKISSSRSITIHILPPKP